MPINIHLSFSRVVGLAGPDPQSGAASHVRGARARTSNGPLVRSSRRRRRPEQRLKWRPDGGWFASSGVWFAGPRWRDFATSDFPGGAIVAAGVLRVMDLDPRIGCHRCARICDPRRLATDLWLVLDTRPDGWLLLVCASCQTEGERAVASAAVIDAADRRASRSTRTRRSRHGPVVDPSHRGEPRWFH